MNKINKGENKMKTNYEVIVGNIGTTLRTNNKRVAMIEFNDYVKYSKTGCGKVAGENVYLMENGEPVKEYNGTNEEGYEL